MTDGRMTWSEIKNKYPDQWVGLTDVEWKNASNVRTAVVKYADMTADELGLIQIEDPDLYSVYTTPDNLAPLGVVGYMR